MVSSDFMLGFGLGFLVALVVGGFFWNIYRNWRRDIDAPDKLQPMSHLTTTKTPRQIMEAAAAAWAKFFVFCLFLIVFLWIAFEIAFPNLAEVIHTILGNLWAMLVG